jgi:hypothetical protein
MVLVDFLRWTVRMVRDVVWCGVVNRSLGVSVAILFLLLVGVLAIGAKASAPFIYTLF